MKKFTKHITIILIFFCLVVQTGCWNQQLLEDIGFILQMGLELDQDGKMLFSVTSPVVDPDVEEKVELLYTSSENLIRSSRERLRNVSGKLLQGGKIQLVYFSKDLAHKGINEFFEVFLREPENPLLANVVVVDGSPREMMELSSEYKDKPRSAFYINDLLADARRRSVAPESRIYSFNILSYSKTIDPVTPIIRYDKNEVKVIGTALFEGDKLVGEITRDQTLLLNALMGEKTGGEYIYEDGGLNQSSEKIKKNVVVSIKDSKRKIKIETGENIPKVDIKLKFKTALNESSGNYKLDNDEDKKTLERGIAKEIQDRTMELLKHLQNVGADPIGFGEIVRAKHNKYWKAVKWKEVYKDTIFKVEVDINIETYGTIN